jgi:hypothetical protein
MIRPKPSKVILTSTESAAYGLEIAEKKCRVCAHKDSTIWGVTICGIGKAWPKFGNCKSFEDEK